MATVTGLTASRMQEIEAASVVEGEVVAGNLILTKHDGTEINAGPVTGAQGPPGPPGPALVAIPGEVKLWPGDTLPDLATYGKWVWADGAYYPIADHPIAAGHIADAWNTFAGASDPGPTNFRVPDLRGLVASGMDAMPGGSRANRMTRADAIILAKRTGKETHSVTTLEMPSHSHGGFVVSGGEHMHYLPPDTLAHTGKQIPGWSAGYVGHINAGPEPSYPYAVFWLLRVGGDGTHSHGINLEGSNNAHENVQPTVFVPYIVCLDS